MDRSGDCRFNTVIKISRNPSEHWYCLKFGRHPKITIEVRNSVTDLDNVVAGELGDESGTLPVLGMAQAQLTSLIP